VQRLALAGCGELQSLQWSPFHGFGAGYGAIGWWRLVGALGRVGWAHEKDNDGGQNAKRTDGIGLLRALWLATMSTMFGTPWRAMGFLFAKKTT
jgi:hypothetical protein